MTTKSDAIEIPEVEGSEIGPGGGEIVFENERVRVWDIRLGAGERSKLHTHALDYMLIQLEGDKIAVEPHPETKSQYKEFFEAEVVPGATIYMERGGVEWAVNTGRRPWRELCIEFKETD
jgi:quercetin dioxygenase-like cupin family protein